MTPEQHTDIDQKMRVIESHLFDILRVLRAENAHRQDARERAHALSRGFDLLPASVQEELADEGRQVDAEADASSRLGDISDDILRCWEEIAKAMPPTIDGQSLDRLISL